MAEQKPSLSDQHWRVRLRRLTPRELEAEMIETVADGNRWRFDILMQLPQFWSEQQTAIAAAVQNGRVEMLRTLVSKNPKWRDRIDLNACLETAIEQNHLPMLKYLAEELGAPVSNEKETVLTTAASKGNIDAVEYLLSKGCRADAYDSHALVMAAEEGHLDVVKKLAAAGGDINADDAEALKRALRYNMRETAVWLLQQGLDPGEYTAEAVMQSCKMGETDIARLLLEGGAELAPYQMDRALIGALQNANYDAASLCLKYGANIDAEHGDALRHAVSVNDHDTIRFIVAHGGDVNAVHKGDTVLMTAASRGHLDAVTLLIDLGADVARMNFGVIRKAADEGYKDISHAVARYVRDSRKKLQKEKMAEFQTLFPAGYTVDDLRKKLDASGQCAFEIAAQTGQFSKIILNATAGQVEPSDLFLPDDKIDTVLSHLVEHKSLQQFFEPALWAGRRQAVEEALALLPDHFRERINIEALAAGFKQQNIKPKNQGRRPGL